MRKRLLIVGANSFVAAELARIAANEGYQLHGVYRKTTDRIDETHYEEVTDDLTELRLAEFDAVVFFASFIPYGRMNEPDPRLDEVNDFLKTVAEQFNETRFVYCSSVSVYGTPTKLPLNESSAINASTAYGAAKLAGEKIVENCSRGISVRIGSTYGPGMRGGTLMESWCRSAKESGSITVFGDGKRMQDYVHVNDVARCLLAAVESDWSGPALCVSNESVSNRTLAFRISEHLDGCETKNTGSDNSPSFTYDPTQTIEQLDWKPMIRVNDGIRELIDSL